LSPQQYFHASLPPSRSASSEKLANKTYSELIVEAIESHPQKRLTLSQIYEWLIENVPTCWENANKPSSTGWKNCVRHNLSLHKEFRRQPIDTKNSYWYIDSEALQRKRSSKHSTAGRKRARSFTSTMQPQGFDFMSVRDRIRTKSLGNKLLSRLRWWFQNERFFQKNCSRKKLIRMDLVNSYK
jgi:hypothetical protein